MTHKYFKTPFAASGEKTEIVELTQTDGTVSYQEGYGPDYAKNQEDVGAKFIERAQMNGLFNEITANLKLWQEQGFYPYNPDISYTIGGRCNFDDGSGMKAYVSTINNNTNVPSKGGVVQSGWQLNDVKAVNAGYNPAAPVISISPEVNYTATANGILRITATAGVDRERFYVDFNGDSGHVIYRQLAATYTTLDSIPVRTGQVVLITSSITDQMRCEILYD